MERRQEQYPQSAPQPIPLVQILPDGRLAYITLPMAPGQPPPLFSSPSQSPFEAITYRDRWARVVKVAGVIFLLMGVIGMAARLCFLMENDRAYQWVLWAIALGLDLLAICAGLLGMRAGSNKTSASARCYLRFLVFFAVLYVLATIVGTMLVVKIETKWVERHREFSPTNYHLQGTVGIEEDGFQGSSEETPGAGLTHRREEGDGMQPERRDRHRRPREDDVEPPKDREGRPWHRNDRNEEGDRRWEKDEGRHGRDRNEDERHPRNRDEAHRRRDRDEDDKPHNGADGRRHRPDRDEDEKRPHDKDDGHKRRDQHEDGKPAQREDRRHPRPDRNEDERRPFRKDDDHQRRDDRNEGERSEPDQDRRHPRTDRNEGRESPRDQNDGHRRRDRDEDNKPWRRHDRDDGRHRGRDWRHRRHPRPWHRDEDDRRPDWDEDWAPTAFVEYSEGNLLAAEATTSLRSKTEKKQKYGDRDEMQPISREEMENALLVGAFLGVLCTICACSCCLFCACRLLTHTQHCEALYPQAVQQFAYSQPQFAQPVQAVPLASPAVYPNLAPVGSAVPYSR